MVDIEKEIIPVIETKMKEQGKYFRMVREGVYCTRCPFVVTPKKI